MYPWRATTTDFSDPKLEALRTFAGVMVDKRGRASKEEVAAFLVAGYTQAPILEVIAGIASKTMSNFINHLADTPIDKQFEPFRWEPPKATQSAA